MASPAAASSVCWLKSFQMSSEHELKRLKCMEKIPLFV